MSESEPSAPIDQQPPATQPEHKTGPGRVSLLREILETLALALLVFLVIQTVWRHFWVEGSSMEPNIHNGQFLVVERLVYSQGFPVNLLRATIGRTPGGSKLLNKLYHPAQRGDVIVFIPPSNPGKDYIKRVIGVPGDKVEVRQGRALVNDRPLAEPYIMPGSTSSWGPAYVGQGELFVLGDNRGNSSDSRSFGMLQQKNVVGKAWLCYWPPRRWGFIRHYALGAQLQGR